MRIIAGNLKGKKIIIPNDNFTRPLKDLTKESIFNIIEHSNLLNINLDNSKVLDLFSGVGSFGLECVSRGAESVTFFENYSEVLKILASKNGFVGLSLYPLHLKDHGNCKIEDFCQMQLDLLDKRAQKNIPDLLKVLE